MTPTFQTRRPSFCAAQPLAQALGNRAHFRSCCQCAATLGNREARGCGLPTGKTGAGEPFLCLAFPITLWLPGGRALLPPETSTRSVQG